VIAVAHEAGKSDDLRVVPFPNGAVIARLAWRYTPSDVNNRSFGDTIVGRGRAHQHAN
jgi:hypothetical protein